MLHSLIYLLRTLGVVAFCLAAACAEKAVVPTQRMITPVVSGGFLKGHADMRGVGTIDAILVDDLTSSTPSYEPDVYENSDFGVGIDLGIFKRVDLYVHGHILGDTRYGVKWQILGPTLQEARQGWVLAVNAGFGTQATEKTAESNISDRKGIAETSLSALEYGVSIGNWVRPSLLLYVGGGRATVSSSTKFNQRDIPFTTTLINEKVKGEGSIDTVNFDFTWGQQIYLHGEFLYTKASWTKKEPGDENTDRWEGTQYGGGLGYNW